jgi:aryl-alcohol dehydrogenase-like predicted oxidoreductase
VHAPYSVHDRDKEQELIPMAAEHDLAVTPVGMLEGGGLSGKHLGGDPSNEGAGRIRDLLAP